MALVVHTQGLQFLLEAAMNGAQSKPANFYVGLATDVSLAKTALLGDQTELAATFGYARQPIPSNAANWISASDGGDGRKLTGEVATFAASGGDWVLARTLFVATTIDDSGVLLASGPINGGVGTLRTNGTTYAAQPVIILP